MKTWLLVGLVSASMVGCVIETSSSAGGSDSGGSSSGGNGSGASSSGGNGSGGETNGSGGAATGGNGSGGGETCFACGPYLFGEGEPLCEGNSTDLLAAFDECACGETGNCTADCGDNLCSALDESEACTACLESLKGCQAELENCTNDQ